LFHIPSNFQVLALQAEAARLYLSPSKWSSTTSINAEKNVRLLRAQARSFQKEYAHEAIQPRQFCHYFGPRDQLNGSGYCFSGCRTSSSPQEGSGETGASETSCGAHQASCKASDSGRQDRYPSRPSSKTRGCYTDDGCKPYRRGNAIGAHTRHSCRCRSTGLLPEHAARRNCCAVWNRNGSHGLLEPRLGPKCARRAASQRRSW